MSNTDRDPFDSRGIFLSAIQQYEHVDITNDWETLPRAVMNMNSLLVLIPDFKFVYFLDRSVKLQHVKLQHVKCPDIPESELIEMLNETIDRDLVYYSIPYRINFIKGRMTIYCNITKIDLIAPEDTLRGVLSI